MSYLKKADALASIKIRTMPHNGSNYTIFEAYLGTDPYSRKAIRKSAKTEAELKKKINEFYRRIDIGGDIAVILSPFETADAKNALDLLKLNNLTASLSDCARAFIEASATTSKGISTITLGTAYPEYLQVQTDDGKSEDHIRTIKTRVGRWVSTFGADRPLSDITANDVANQLRDQFLDPARPETRKTYNNNLSYIKSFLNWCCNEKQYLKENPLNKLKNKVIAYKDPEYVSATNTALLITAVATKGSLSDLACFILSFFCGLRQSELMRCYLGKDAIDINLEEVYIRVIKCKGETKGVEPRTFTIPDIALAWMKSFDFMTAVRMKNLKFRNHLTKIAKSIGINDLPENAGRHTFITMHAAAYHDPNALTAIAGNSVSVRARHYDGRTSQKEGLEYFQILPPAKVVSDSCESTPTPQPSSSQV